MSPLNGEVVVGTAPLLPALELLAEQIQDLERRQSPTQPMLYAAVPMNSTQLSGD